MVFAPADLPAICARLNFQVEALTAAESNNYHLLRSDYHKDPFDRMLIWLVIAKGYTLITGDEDISKYVSEGLKIY